MNLLRRFCALFRRAALDREMDAEMRAHLARETEQNLARGMSPDAARAAARRAFGGIDRIQEVERDARAFRWIENLGRDLRFGARMLRKNPFIALAAIVTLALGVGANTAVFSVLNGVLLRPLDYPAADQLVIINESSEQVPGMSVAYPNFLDWRQQQKCFSAIGVTRGESYNLRLAGGTERVTGSVVTHDLLEALGLEPVRGRRFTAADDEPGAAPTVLLSEALWQRHFQARDSVLGEQVNLSGKLYRVIGIMPGMDVFPGAGVEAWTPLGLMGDNQDYRNRANHPGLAAVARLAPGISLERARAEMAAIAVQLAQQYPASNAGQTVRMDRLIDRQLGKVRPVIFMLLGAAGFVLLIGIANVANLQLARAQSRSHEFAVRASLGASRGRVVRQLVAESLLLGLTGCAAGLLLGQLGLVLLKSILPAGFPRLSGVRLDEHVLAFAIAVSLGASLLAGIFPALQAGRFGAQARLTTGTRVSDSPGSRRWCSGLIVAELALTCVLLVGAGLMLRTVANLYAADPGFKVKESLTVSWNLDAQNYDDDSKRAAGIERALEQLRALPGVTSVGVVRPLPLVGWGNQSGYYIEGAPEPEPGRGPSTERIVVNGDYFTTVGIKLHAGRTFDARDDVSGVRVAIVDTRFVEKNMPGENPIGRRIVLGRRAPRDPASWMQIVGVVEHIQNYSIGGFSREQVYVPHTQGAPADVSFVLGTAGDPAALTDSVRIAMREVAPDSPVYEIEPLETFFARTITGQRISLSLLGVFASLALLLAAIGIFGVLSYNVGQRTREIGVRMALGATRTGVVIMVLRGGVGLCAIGLGLGLVASCGFSQVLGSMLHGVSALDPLAYSGVAVVLGAVALLACWLPARRAARVDPLIALRAE